MMWPVTRPELCECPMYLLAALMFLFAGWMFLGWIVGESRDIRWMKHWCAGIFVVSCVLICLGSGVWIAHRMTQSSYRTEFRQLTRLLNDRMKEDRIDDVRVALQHLADDPDEASTFSRDPLQRLTDVSEALRKTARNQIATKPENLQ